MPDITTVQNSNCRLRKHCYPIAQFQPITNQGDRLDCRIGHFIPITATIGYAPMDEIGGGSMDDPEGKDRVQHIPSPRPRGGKIEDLPPVEGLTE